MGDWTQVGENLVRNANGTIYLRAKVAGKIIRRTLRTKDIRVAKMIRDRELKDLRNAPKPGDLVLKTLGDALNAAEKVAIGPHLKPSTVLDYQKGFTRLRKSLPLKTHAGRWSEAEAVEWWHSFSGKLHAQKANQALRLLRIAFDLLRRHGKRVDDPTERLKRIKAVKQHRDLPSRQEIEALIASVRSQGKANSIASARYIAFLAFTGTRHGEASKVRWKDVGKDWVTITGGKEGTKNRRVRQVPISEPLRALLNEMRADGVKQADKLFLIKSPRIALDNACERLGLSHIRIHDLRHWFGSWAVESGIDYTTISKWMGHQDGGVLLMRTYAHLRDEHSLKQAKRLK